MSNIKYIALTLLAVICSSPVMAEENASVYDRVMEAKTIRCGYIPYEPYLSKDAATGEMSGLMYEYVNHVGGKLGLKIDWAGEVNIDQVVPAMEAGRFDMFCVPATPDVNWEKVLEFVGDVGALPYYVYVRADSNMPEEELKTATFTTVDGYAMAELTTRHFPEARYQGLPQTVSTAEMYDQMRYGKADAIVNEHVSAVNYMKHNPGIIRRFSDKPVAAQKMFLITKKGDMKMADFVSENFNANEGENLEFMKSLLEKYNVPEGSLLLGDECKKSIITEGKRERICVLD